MILRSSKGNKKTVNILLYKAVSVVLKKNPLLVILISHNPDQSNQITVGQPLLP